MQSAGRTWSIGAQVHAQPLQLCAVVSVEKQQGSRRSKHNAVHLVRTRQQEYQCTGGLPSEAKIGNQAAHQGKATQVRGGNRGTADLQR